MKPLCKPLLMYRQLSANNRIPDMESFQSILIFAHVKVDVRKCQLCLRENEDYVTPAHDLSIYPL